MREEGEAMELRVAAYCRVSTDREDQANSLRSQRTYFAAYIRDHPGWRLAEVYADEGTSGTDTRGREAFCRMIRAAEAGALDLIVTKEVSRFARNTVDALGYTRRLKALGVGVVFISDGIDTREGDGELRLTLMAGIAQEESRKTSERVRWGQRRRMEQGVVFGNDTLYGYRLHQGVLTVREEEAQVVRLIYGKYLSEGKGTHVIARELFEAGIPPPRSASGKWSGAMVLRILRNEKYVGDLVQKKSVTTDYLTHRREPNRGQEELICLRDHHAPVVERSMWEAAQAELDRRAPGGEPGRYAHRYWCSGKLRCGLCGGSFVPRRRTRADGSVYVAWGCRNRVRCGGWRGADGTAGGCGLRMVNGRTLDACAAFVLERLPLDWAGLLEGLLARLDALPGGRAEETPRPLAGRRAELEARRARALDAFLAGELTEEELQSVRKRYDAGIARLRAQEEARGGEEARRLAARADRDAALEALRQEAARSRHVWAQAVERMVLDQDSIALSLRGLPLRFRLWYDTEGRGAGYRTVIRRWALEPEGGA